MNPVQQALMAHAAALRTSALTAEDVAVDVLVKQAGLSEAEARLHVAQDAMEKAACAALAEKGIDHLEAAKMVKAAKFDASSLIYAQPAVKKENVTADILEKAAGYIQELEYQIAALEVQNDELAAMNKEASYQTMELPEPLDRMRQSGAFTMEDLEQLQSLEGNLLHKVATANSDEGWSMGSASGKPIVVPSDPLLAWLTS